jgi:virginiamycin B lyase
VIWRSKQLVLMASFVAALAGIGASTAAAEITQNFQHEGSQPLDIVAVPEGDPSEGNLWYTGAVSPFLCAVGASTGGVTMFELPNYGTDPVGVECKRTTEFVGNGTNGIALGPEGDPWFTAGGGIGRIEPSATEAEEFFVPPAREAIEEHKPVDLTLGGITVGPDGNLWFTEVQPTTTPAANIIGRINPTKPTEIKEFTLPAQNELGGGVGGANIENIAAGPNNTLWFTEPGSHAIGVINTEGKFLRRFVLNESDDPQSIAAGPEGNMWFTDPATPYMVGRINPAGEVSEFPAPSSPTSIVEGPEGNMWFTQGGTSPEAGLGCIIPTGQIELYRDPNEGGDPVGITVSKDGSIWFTDSRADGLDRLYPVACGAKAPSAPPPSGSTTPTTPTGGTTGTNTTGTSTTTKTTTPTTPPLATVLGLPPAQQCVSKRTLLVHVRPPPGQQLLSVKLSLEGKVLRAETFTRGKNHKVPPTLVDLRGLPKGTFTLTIVVKTKGGKTYRATRTYHTCVPGKYKQGKKH